MKQSLPGIKNTSVLPCTGIHFYEGTQQFKLVASREIRTIRVNLIFELNNTKVFL